jgi:hypothetical protein
VEKRAKCQILCLAQSQMFEWDRQNVILTGGSDGVVRMWSLDYVEVPVQAPEVSDPGSPISDKTNISTVTELAKKMSISLSGDCLSSLRDAVARYHKVSLTSERSVEDQSSDTEDCDDITTDKQSDLDCSNGPSPAPELSIDPPSPVRSQFQSSGSNIPDPPEISVTCTSDESFVVVEGPVEEGVEVLDSGPAMMPGDGYMWSRQLVFRAKLTMHTAFERSDNSEPAAVTALAASKDHKTLYVGDDRGRVFSWMVSNKPGKGLVDHWMKDDGTDSCQACGIRFTMYERRHHCRNCGNLFCSSCSRYQAEIPRLKIHQPVRVCKQCHSLS